MHKLATILIIIVIILIIIYFTIRSKKETKAYQKGYPVPGYTNIDDPYIEPFVVQNILTPDQCKQIIEHARGKLTDSEIISGKIESVRNSKQCWISKTSPLVKSLFENMSQTFGIPVENAEDLQVVRYLPGQYFKEHHDGCCDNNSECKKFINKSGQRILTILIYLNDDFKEGHTYFPNLNLKIKTEPGNAIVFYPTGINTNFCHPKALHSGTAVAEGEKWVANLWFHERKFQY